MRAPAHTVTIVLMLAALTGCASKPFDREQPAATPPPTAGRGPNLPTPPQAPEETPAEPVIEVPPPPPVPKERPKVTPATLSSASKALVSQAQSQRKKGDLPGATVSLERALRIEPRNPLLWIEMGRLRMDQRNYPQAEAMGRKALSVAIGDEPTQASAWRLIADALKARGRNPEAEEALARSQELAPL